MENGLHRIHPTKGRSSRRIGNLADEAFLNLGDRYTIGDSVEVEIAGIWQPSMKEIPPGSIHLM